MKMFMRVAFLALILAMFTACTWTVQDARTAEQKSADRTRVAESLPPLGTIRVELLPQETPPLSLLPTVTPTPEPEVVCQDILGNINAKGEKIYHVAGQANYNTVKPEAYFCTEAEAQAAGYRKSLR